jgi:hypothetical protein
MRKITRTVAAFCGLIMITLGIAQAAQAGQPTTQPLNPPPPSFETCKTVGNGVICDGSRVETYANDSGAACGSGADSFDPTDHGLDYQHAIRFYDTNGDLLKRVIYDHDVGAFSNPLTGASVPYNQHLTTTDVLAVPSEFGSATETTTGSVNFTVPGMGAVLLNAGRTVFDPNGNLDFSAGPQSFVDYFVNGNTSAVDQLCTALGA